MRGEKRHVLFALCLVGALLLGPVLLLAIAYGGGVENVYVTYASWGAYALTALLLLCLYGIWRLRGP